ncbi:uncharacterized protein [Arachis hypogaea]|uniref:uncharacterized protein n=1 Tax=Arachis hypogaea TaxID=3818 RepID=UPI003B222CD3
MAGTVTVLKTSPVRVGDQVDESTVYFHRLFWTFPPYIEAFRNCKPLVSIDGTHLYGKYGGTLLLAIAQDGNSNILPIAFALVEGENAESWSFFLSNLRSHVTPQEGIFVISDRHNGIKAALEDPENGWLPSRAFRAYCIRHVAANFSLSSKTAEAQLGSGHEFCQALVKVIERNIRDSRCFTVTLYDRHQSEYTVAETTLTGNFSLGSYRVSLKDHICDCGHFQALHYPCCHAIACCGHSRLNWASYVHEVYRMIEVFNVYKQGFIPPIPEGLWPPYANPTVIPDSNMRRAREGRPKATRICGSMDQSVDNRLKRCGLCRQPGHTRRNCDQRRHTAASDG